MSFKKTLVIFLFLSGIVMPSVVAQSSTCEGAEPFCTTDGVDFANTTGVSDSGGVGCLEQTPNPTYFFLKIENDGDLFMEIEQNTAPDFTGTPLDVDFIAWGPFTQSEFQAGVCDDLVNTNIVSGVEDNDPNTPPNTTTSQGCSYSPSAVENFNVIGATAGDYYVLMVTNWSNQIGYVRMDLVTGTGTTDCSILEATLGPDQDVCEGDTVVLDGTPTEGTAIAYAWYLDTGSGFNLLAGETSATLSPTISGTYRVEVTDDENETIFDDVIVTFHEQPIANQPIGISICDDTSNDGIEDFNLAMLKDSEILNGQDPNLFTITYHESLSDAQGNVGVLPSVYTSVAGSYPKTIYVRIENNNNVSCFDTTSFTLEVFDSANPLDSSSINPINLCDSDLDGFEEFNLTDRETDILNGQSASDFTLTYFTDSGYSNQINTPSAFTNTIIDVQTIYVRMTNNANINCFADTSFVIEVFAQPVANMVSDINICDGDNNGLYLFNLESQTNAILDSQDPMEFSVTYHLSQADADASNNPITSPYENTSNPQTIYVRIENNDNSNCYDTTSFNIQVFDTPNPLVSSNISLLSFCDNTSSGTDTDGFIVFNLEDREVDILNGQSASEFTLSYYTDSGYSSQIMSPSNFTNTIEDGQTIYVRMTNNNNSNCFADTSFEIEVYELPVVNSNVQLIQCDDDNDGIVPFNLTEANELISSNFNNETITYYLTQAEADSGLVNEQITNFMAYPNPNPLSGIVYARIETTDGCYRTSQIDLIVGATQIPSNFSLNYNVCDDILVDNDNTNGVATFDFSDAETTILGLFPGNVSTTYYTNLADALAETNAILDISNHRNDASPFVQDIYVRVDSDNVNACLGLGAHITLTVDALPLANNITDYEVCSSTGVADFDLSTKDNEVRGAQTQDLLISYHTSINDAINNNAAVNFISGVPGGVIYVRSQFDNNGNGSGDVGECVNTDMSFRLVVIPNPILTSPAPIRICNDQVNTVYDLTVREDEITNNDNSIVLTYFETQTDLDNNNPIADPTSYSVSQLNSTVLVLATGSNLCTSIVDLELHTILYDNLNLNPSLLEECEVDNDGYDSFDLTRRETEILNGLNFNDFVFTYYELEEDAIQGNSNNIPDPTSFVNTQKDNQTIYVRIQPVANECYQVATLPIIVNPVPEIEIEDEYVICVDPNGAIIPPMGDILLAALPIDTQLDPSLYTFEWYSGTQADAANSIAGATDSTYSPAVEGYYTVIATDIVSGCTIPATTLVIGSYPPQSMSLEVTTNAFSGNDIIEVTVVGTGTYEFSLDFGAWQSSSTFENVTGGEHEVRVRDLYGCNQIVASTLVMDYPRYFTPNGDGFNDTWQIHGIDRQLDAKIYIFNRYGKLLKQLSPTSQGWDGTFNGDPLPTDDYWFTVEYNEPNDTNTRKEFRAHFTLKR